MKTDVLPVEQYAKLKTGASSKIGNIIDNLPKETKELETNFKNIIKLIEQLDINDDKTFFSLINNLRAYNSEFKRILNEGAKEEGLPLSIGGARKKIDESLQHLYSIKKNKDTFIPDETKIY